jgi:hypothetical protein
MKYISLLQTLLATHTLSGVLTKPGLFNQTLLDEINSSLGNNSNLM